MGLERKSIDPIRVAAYEWHSQFVAGDMSPAEQQRFESWLAADPRHRAAYERAARLRREMQALDKADLPPAGFRPLSRERFVAWCRVAWCRVAWCRVGWAHWSPRAVGGSLAFATAVFVLLQVVPFGFFDPTAEHFETAVAEIRDVTLADGSVVTLGAKSRFSVAMDGKARRLELYAGEAFFDVASDPNRPFIVSAKEVEVAVLGTAFDLKLAGEGLRVAVAEGVVEVGHASAMRLRAGQQISVTHDSEFGKVTSVDPVKLGVWRRNRLVYVGASLSEVVADANRYHDGWIFLRDQRAADIRITGGFDPRDIDAMFATLADAFPIVVWRPLDAVTIIGSDAPD